MTYRRFTVGSVLRVQCFLSVFLALSGMTLQVRAGTSDLRPKLLPNVEAATFEVVAAKPENDPLSYAKPLPMDLIPYQQRTDKYHSIGTAFALGHNRYVTAGHVLLKGLNSLWGAPELRDGSGHVYAIDKVIKFSLRQDFAMFSLKHPPGTGALAVDTHPALNQTVYAVGNALGTGIVIRNGLYTSNTPEQQDGSWKWMRFSAAASPGNSGGPLLDAHGKVIGVVLAKSPNENLNYALPIGEVMRAPEGKAVIDKRRSFGFGIFDDTVNHIFMGSFPLPKSLADFYANLGKRENTYDDTQLAELLHQHAAHIFPNGTESQRLLRRSLKPKIQLPVLITRNSNGIWAMSVKHAHQMDLDHHVRVQIGHASHDLLFHVRKPRAVPVSELHQHPDKVMDLLLQTGILKRRVASEQIKITSFGKPSRVLEHTDRWGRTWQVAEWRIPFNNQCVFMLGVPTPSGYTGLLEHVPSAQEHDAVSDVEALSDFMFFNIGGTLKQWEAFLDHPDLDLRVFKRIHIAIDYGNGFSFRFPHANFRISPEILGIQPESELELGFSFLESPSGVAWGVNQVRYKAQVDAKDALNFQRMQAPVKESVDAYRAIWNKALKRQPPFDGSIQQKDDVANIAAVVNEGSGHPPPALDVIRYSKEGNHSQKTMQSKLKLFLDDFRIVRN